MCAEYFTGQPIDVANVLIGAKIIKDIIRNSVFTKNYSGRVFPRSLAPVLIFNSSTQSFEFKEAEFSLIPRWWKPDPKKSKAAKPRPPFATHNARLDSIESKPSFRESFQKYHCLVPMDSFFESSLFGDLYPGHRIQLRSNQILTAAGLYSDWINIETGEIIPSFTILTDHPSVQIFNAGHDRMPIFLTPESATDWITFNFGVNKNSKDFLLEKNLKNRLNLEINIDRPLKEGWQKNAPSLKEIDELKKVI